MQPIVVALISNSIVASFSCAVGELAWRLRRPALGHAIFVLALVKLMTPAIWHVPLPNLPVSARTISTTPVRAIPSMAQAHRSRLR